MFCHRNQDITDAKAFFYLFFMSNSGYLDKEKDWQFLNTVRLQLPRDFTSDANLSVMNIR